MGDRKTVGFVMSGIMDEFPERLIKGIIGESEKDDVNIVIIPVKYIDREMKGIPDLYEFQYKTNVETITSTNFDALIVAADIIGCLTTEENLKKFMDGLKARGIPIVLAASKMDEYPGVMFDNKAGIIEGIEYLVEELNVKKIGMMKSYDHNKDVAERYEAFKEMLAYYKLDLDPKSVITTNLSVDCREDCERFLDLNPDIEAVLCVNDDVAKTFYAAMKDRGLVPGRDIKVMGFDNSISGSMMTPSLTTVDASAKNLGKRVFTMARMIMDGWNVGQTTIPTSFILRDSFGSFLDKNNTDDAMLNKNNLDKYFHRVFFKFDNISKQEDLKILIMYKALMNTIIDYVDDHEYSAERVAFLKTKMDEFFKTGALEYTDADVLLAYVERIKAAIMARFDDYERKCQAYETFSALLEKIVRTLRDEVVEYKTSMNESIYTLKNMVEDSLNFNHGGDESYTTIVSNLAMFGVENAYVYIYDRPIFHEQGEEFAPPKKVRLKVAMTDGEIKVIPPEQQFIELDHLYDNKFLPTKKYRMVQMPLYFKETLYGFVLYDLNDVSFRSGDFIANQYATVARLIDILGQNDRLRTGKLDKRDI